MHIVDAILTRYWPHVYSFGAPSDGFLEVEWRVCESPQIRGNVFPIMHACAKRSIIDAFTLLLAFHSPSLADVAHKRLLKQSLEAQF